MEGIGIVPRAPALMSIGKVTVAQTGHIPPLSLTLLCREGSVIEPPLSVRVSWRKSSPGKVIAPGEKVVGPTEADAIPKSNPTLGMVMGFGAIGGNCRNELNGLNSGTEAEVTISTDRLENDRETELLVKECELKREEEKVVRENSWILGPPSAQLPTLVSGR